jgi:hypothetical protein
MNAIDKMEINKCGVPYFIKMKMNVIKESKQKV